MRHALINPNGAIDRFESNIDPTVQTKAGWKWLPYVEGARPAYDPASEVIEGPAYTVGASEVTGAWTKRSLTAGEISDRKDGRISAIDMLQFQVSFDIENRVRALEAKTPITATQYRAALKARL